jgi:hypothetical protein
LRHGHFYNSTIAFAVTFVNDINFANICSNFHA